MILPMKKGMPKLEFIIAYVIFGTVGVFRKAVPLNSGMLSMLRGFIGAATLVLILFLSKNKINFKSIKANLGLLCLSGAAIGINWILLFEAYKYTTVAIATLCYYMAPVLMIVFSALILREHVSKTNIICILIAVLGMCLISGIGIEKPSQGQITGILLSLGAAVLYAVDVIANKKMKNINATDRTVVQLFTAGLVTVPYAFFVEQPAGCPLTWKIVILVAVLGIVHTGLSYALAFDGIAKLSTQTVAFFTYIDPVLAVILSALVLKEGITPTVIIGAVCILGSALYNELKSN